MSAAIDTNRPSSSSRMGLRRLLSYVSARDISRALVRREGPSPTGITPLSVFSHGQDTRIQNSTVNTTVHYHYTARSPPESNSTESTPQQINVQPADGNSSASSATDQTITLREAQEVYVDIMITKNRGFPLWIPSPNTSLPRAYRSSGVSIGDVGILTPDGGFDFIFNIFADASHPINAHSGFTDNFRPLRPPLRPHEVQRFKQNIAGTLVGDHSFERTDNLPSVVLRTSASEAAVLMMPEDVYAVKIQNQERLRTYIGEHIVSWYTHVRQNLGRDISNGDLRVVYGYRKSTAFGIAAVSTTKKPAETLLTFYENEAWARQRGYKYQWSQVGSADIKTGPEYRESAELMYPAYGTSMSIPENQCLFISTLDTKLSEGVWKSMKSLGVFAGDTTHSEASPESSLRPETHLNQSTGHNHDSSSGEHSSAVSSTRSIVMHFLSNKPSEPIMHPSNILNDVLLGTNPEANFSIVCDDDWEDYMDCLDPLEFVSEILCQSNIVIEKDVVYIDSSPTNGSQAPNPVNAPSIHPWLSTHAVGSIFHNFDLAHPISRTPGTDNYIPSDVLPQLVTVSPISPMRITCGELPWPITVESRSASFPFITIDDVFSTIYASLLASVSGTEFYKMLPTKAAQDAVSMAFRARCERAGSTGYGVEKAKGLKRVDFLLGLTRFCGLTAVNMGLNGWVLEVSDSGRANILHRDHGGHTPTAGPSHARMGSTLLPHKSDQDVKGKAVPQTGLPHLTFHDASAASADYGPDTKNQAGWRQKRLKDQKSEDSHMTFEA